MTSKMMTFSFIEKSTASPYTYYQDIKKAPQPKLGGSK